MSKSPKPHHARAINLDFWRRPEGVAVPDDELSFLLVPDAVMAVACFNLAKQVHAYQRANVGSPEQITRALMAKPSLLIADEPTTALDATLEVQIIKRLRELQSRISCSVLFISHHLGVIAELCDEVVVMYAGEVVEHGDVRDVFHRSAHPYTRKLLECDPGHIKKRTRHLPTIPGQIPDFVELPQGCIFESRCALAVASCKTQWPLATALSASHRASCHLLGKNNDGIAAT